MVHNLLMNGLRLEEFFSSNPNPNPNPNPNLASSITSLSAAASASLSSASTSTAYIAAAADRVFRGTESSEDSEVFSDIVLNYISKMLMEEDVDEKVNIMYREQTAAAIQAAEKPFYDILAGNYQHPPLPSYDSPEYSSSSSWNSTVSSYPAASSSNNNNNNNWFLDAVAMGSIYQSSLESSSSGIGENNAVLASQFRKGVEEAQKFLPSGNRLVIGVGAKTDRREQQQQQQSRGRKNPNSDDLYLIEGRSAKQSAVSASSDETVRSEMFDKILLCQGDGIKKCDDAVEALRESIRNNNNSTTTQAKPPSTAAGGSKKKQGGKKEGKKEVVDLRTLLITCSEAVAADDRRTADELLKQIRHYSSPFGDGTQRLAHCFADGLEARLAGTGSQIYQSLVAKRTTATDILKAYQLYLAACPFKRISHFFSNQTILNAAENASIVHIIDFGIYFGFQWPCLIQRLATRPGGPPKLRITGIDVPQPGFRPTERVEETGKRLADYASSFNVPFEYNAIASKWETIRVEDLKIEKGEVLVVNCLYRFRNLVDETVLADSPRSRVMNTIMMANPTVFIHGVVNGSYNAPFFVTRFREALFHFSALFDMLETNVPGEDAQRLLIERDLFGREALNVISCEGLERVERPETYKQWQVRNLRSGLAQLPLNPDLLKRARVKVKDCYHKDFVVDEDSGWLLQGWKGRIIYAISSWMPKID